MAFAYLPLVAQDELGNKLDDASVLIRNADTLALPVLYSNRAGTDAKGNPYTATDGAAAGCYLIGGFYRIDITKDDVTSTEYRAVGTAQEYDFDDLPIPVTLNPRSRTVTAAGDVTISATDDDVVYVAKTIPAATNVNFPTVAARIAAGGKWIGLKNSHANPALYPLQPVLSGADTMDDMVSPLPQDTNRIRWYKPVAATNDWEIQNG